MRRIRRADIGRGFGQQAWRDGFVTSRPDLCASRVIEAVEKKGKMTPPRSAGRHYAISEHQAAIDMAGAP